MKTALIIHGHFYQPPRENPCTGIVENQSSAAPYKNWNEAVYQTCYRPNAHSRYLDNRGKIKIISNNYESISSNFGPTLLKWMDTEHPKFIESLIEADKKSISTLGHSNFIAQCYNHTILPLDRIEIKRTEISWALEDYKKRFGHDSEGFWCSECAIDKETIDVLAEFGIKFVILSPWQATQINGKDLNGKPAPCDKPFIINGNKSSITAFFYNPDLASGISFGHYLTDADKLYNHLKEMKKSMGNPQLISCATDGEIYGHHEAFGDMALAALIKKVNDGNEFYITNYAAYLEKHPAKDTATLFNGKNHVGSSWSCSHGVERWCSDCGCHTGGPDNWNQKWRAPLRKALQNHEIVAREIITTQLKSILGNEVNFDKIMLNYGKVVVKKITISDFIASLEAEYKTLTNNEKLSVANLLDSYKYILYSFTSCGWFFNDISGIEPTQNITYAVNAAKTLQPFTKTYLKKQLLQDLSLAKSNISSENSGSEIAKKSFDKEPGSVQACYYFIQNKLDNHIEKFKYNYGIFHIRSISDSIIIIENTMTTEISRFTYGIKHNSDNYVINLRNVENGFNYSAVKKYEEGNTRLSQNAILENITISFANEIEKNGINESQFSIMFSALNNLRAEGIEPDLTELQNVLYPLLDKKKSSLSQSLRKTLIEKLNFSYDLL